MEKFSALLALCPPATDEFPLQRPVTRRFDVSFDLRLNTRLSKQSRCWWFETPCAQLWRHFNEWYNPQWYRYNRPMLKYSNVWNVLMIYLRSIVRHQRTTNCYKHLIAGKFQGSFRFNNYFLRYPTLTGYIQDSSIRDSLLRLPCPHSFPNINVYCNELLYLDEKNDNKL